MEGNNEVNKGMWKIGKKRNRGVKEMVPKRSRIKKTKRSDTKKKVINDNEAHT